MGSRMLHDFKQLASEPHCFVQCPFLVPSCNINDEVSRGAAAALTQSCDAGTIHTTTPSCAHIVPHEHALGAVHVPQSFCRGAIGRWAAGRTGPAGLYRCGRGPTLQLVRAMPLAPEQLLTASADRRIPVAGCIQGATQYTPTSNSLQATEPLSALRCEHCQRSRRRASSGACALSVGSG